MEEKKARLRTSSDVYHRIKWESTKDASNFVIGYMDRFAGMMEMPFNEFIPIDEGGEIPFTKIFYFKDGDQVVWDRNTRTDLIFRSGETGEQDRKEREQEKKNQKYQKKKKGHAEIRPDGLHRIVVTHHRYVATPSLLVGRYGDCHVIDVTSDSEDPKWVKFSPYYPHSEIPVPFSPNCFSECVEGIWQGLKVFENQGVDDVKFKTKAMKGLKRAPGGKRGAIKGHSRGVPASNKGNELLDYLEARKQIYVPCYRWVLDNCLQQEVKELREMAKEKTLVLLDYDVNENLLDLSSPLSHASLVKRAILDDWDFEKKREEEGGSGGGVEEREKEKEGEPSEKVKGEQVVVYDSAAYDEGAPIAVKALPQREPRGARGGAGGGGQVKPTRQKQANGKKQGNNNNKPKGEKEAPHDSTKPPPGGVQKQVKSCGVLVFTSWTAERKEFLLMKHSHRYDLPKGHMESGETEIETALRELREETGITATQVKIDPDFRYTETYYPKYKRFGGEVVAKTLCMFLGEVIRAGDEKGDNNKPSITLTEHKDCEWVQWNPPFTNMQKLTVRPLLEAVQRHFAGEDSTTPTPTTTTTTSEEHEGGEDDEDYSDEEEEDEDENELVGDGRLNQPLPPGTLVTDKKAKKPSASAARANRKTRKQRNVLMQAGYSLLDKQEGGQVSIFDNKDINFSSKALTNQAKFILKKNHKASFGVDPDVLKYEGEGEWDEEGEDEREYKPPPRGNLGDYLGIPAEEKKESKGTEWACPTCTFVNPPSFSPICSMCEAPRPTETN